MAAGKRPALPLILTASDLLDGDVVYHDGAGWSRDLADALVARDEAEAQRLEAALARTEAEGVPVAAYLVTVAGADGALVPDHYRERIRSFGPTIRFAADAAPAGREPLDVSL